MMPRSHSSQTRKCGDGTCGVLPVHALQREAQKLLIDAGARGQLPDIVSFWNLKELLLLLILHCRLRLLSLHWSGHCAPVVDALAGSRDRGNITWSCRASCAQLLVRCGSYRIGQETCAGNRIQSLTRATKWQPAIPSKAELSTGINEFYLFHGTSWNIARTICEHGFDERVATTMASMGLAPK